jgi:hypothetical protein
MDGTISVTFNVVPTKCLPRLRVNVHFSVRVSRPWKMDKTALMMAMNAMVDPTACAKHNDRYTVLSSQYQ